MDTTQQSAVVEALDKLYEFEREPVSEDQLQPGKYFAGLFCGEHIAGTEFVIGVLFVKWGASVWDIFVGLALGNALAVLTWTFMCAPIAVQTRLTLYWYLRRIAGPVTTAVYNILNAFLFCILAGCMITVSASAVRIPFGIPSQTGMLPTDIRFVLVVLVVGAVVVSLAVLGFKRLAQFATVCSPWMILMFVAGALAMLPALTVNTPGAAPLRSLGAFWRLAQDVIWTGQAPPGQERITFWQVAAFAWICNLAVHAGLSDMALFRFARHWGYGLYSGVGMFLGHYLAWICAGIMGAAAAKMLHAELSVYDALLKIDAGEMAYTALGVSGILAVIAAGWTTANPTLYRAGLALQAVTPGWPRWLVTLIAGAVTTIMACSPWVFVKLLDFVGLYGLLLMPVGAIVFAEHWIFPRIGLLRYWATRNGRNCYWPALSAWGIAIAAALAANKLGYIHLFFLFVPTWLLTVGLYILFARLAGAAEPCEEKEEDPAPRRIHTLEAIVRKPLSASGWIAGLITLGTLIVCAAWPAYVFVADTGEYAARLAAMRTWMTLPTVLYFIAGTWFAVKWSAAKGE